MTAVYIFSLSNSTDLPLKSILSTRITKYLGWSINIVYLLLLASAMDTLLIGGRLNLRATQQNTNIQYKSIKYEPNRYKTVTET